MRLSKKIYEAEKLFPFKCFLPFTIALFLLFFIAVGYSLLKVNKLFYRTYLEGVVTETYSLHKAKYYRINEDWYLIRGKTIKKLAVGDSLFKEKDSYFIEVYGLDKEFPKIDKEIKRLDFKCLGNDSIPLLSWRDKWKAQ